MKVLLTGGSGDLGEARPFGAATGAGAATEAAGRLQILIVFIWCGILRRALALLPLVALIDAAVR